MITDNEKFKLHLGKSEEVLAQYPDNYFDSVVCDPPYHLTSIVKRFGKQGSAPAQFGTDGAYARASRGFMGKEWDGGDIAFRPEFWTEVFRVLKPGGHLLAFSGSRTYHRMACGIEDAGFEIRDCINWLYLSGFPKSHNLSGDWEGWGTALKPSFEPIAVARKPLAGTVAKNMAEYGTGALNIEGCRIPLNGEVLQMTRPAAKETTDKAAPQTNRSEQPFEYYNDQGRWPANTITTDLPEWFAPYFYCAKASKEDRDEGLGGFEEKVAGGMSGGQDGSLDGPVVMGRNTHPTVKPTDLMRYLCRLVTPPGGLILDPFMGSGSTGKGAMLEGFRFVGIDMTPEYIEIARARIQYAYDQRYDLPALIRNEAKHSPQMSIFDVLPAAELPSYDTEEA